MRFLWAALIGLVVGAIAKLLISGTGPSGCIPTALLGIAGGVFAAVIGQALGWYLPGEPAGFISSVIGAAVLLWLYKIFKKA
ncbi:MAG: GlsB/YeaQ/YmgE family stress response membrane protein [Chthoniobacteraceae bacterium]|nr:GlsB/YeaQ/YmgE family stress response membrane protein [Chthoniobacteraceae bacterium]